MFLDFIPEIRRALHADDLKTTRSGFKEGTGDLDLAWCRAGFR